MKKHLTIIFTIYFFFSSVGIVYSIHSCGKRSSKFIWGVHVSTEKACKCKHDGKTHKKGCCDTTTKWHKAKNDLGKNISATFHLQNYLVPIDFCNFVFSIEKLNVDLVIPASHSPPLLKTPFFIRFRALLIWLVAMLRFALM